MAKTKKTDKRFKLELEFYTRGPVKKIPSINYSYNVGSTDPDHLGIAESIVCNEVFTAFYAASRAVAALLKDEGLIY